MAGSRPTRSAEQSQAGRAGALRNTVEATATLDGPLTGYRMPMNPRRQVTALAVFFFLIGVGLLAITAISLWQTQHFIRTSARASGRVADLEYHAGPAGRGGGRGGFVTVFTFADSSGQAHTARTSDWQNPPTHQIGDAVTVLYQPTNPEAAKIESFSTLWILPTFLGFFGLAFTIIGAVAFVAGRRTYGVTTPPDSSMGARC